MILPRIETPADVRALNPDELAELAAEIRTFIVEAVTTTGGHLGSNLGVVELTLALHRVFESPRDAILWDTGHQAYVHKLLTGRRYGFRQLRQAGGLSGYPNRAESEHDWIENSHASTVLSYAHGLASAFELQGAAVGHGGDRRVVAVIGDGALTGGMAYEALNNLGHSGRRVVVILNDNGRSYAPTVSHLSRSMTSLRLNPTYVQTRERLRSVLGEIPGVGRLAYSGMRGLTSGVREAVLPHTFFEALGVRYAGPIDGHDFEQLEQALTRAAEWDGPIVVHVLTQKGRGYAPAEEDEVQRLHDVKAVRRPAADGLAPTSDEEDGRPSQRPSARRRTPTRSPTPSSGWPRTGPRSSPSPRPCPARPDCCRSRPGSRTGSSTSASPSSTRSPRPPAWRWAASGRSSPSTRPSSPGPSTRPTWTSASTTCPSSTPSTGPASPATTDRATTACSTSPSPSRSPG